MNIKRITDKAVIPTKGSEGAAGYDLYTTEVYSLKPGERKAFKTGIAMAIPEGYYGRIAPRSGLALKYGIDVLAGVIDSDYRAEILVLLVNFGSEEISLPVIKDGKQTAIAQIIFEPYATVTNGFKEVEELNVTQRGEGGFGSSDKKRETAEQAAKQMSTMEELYSKMSTNVVTPSKKYTQLVSERDSQQFNN